MYNTFLSHTSITSKKKTHLARRTLPAVLEEMGHVKFGWSRQGRDANTFETEFLLTRWMLPAIGKGIHGKKSTVLKFLKQCVTLVSTFIHFGINIRWQSNVGRCCVGRVSSRWNIFCAVGTGKGSRCTAKRSFPFLWRCVSKASCSRLSKPRND